MGNLISFIFYLLLPAALGIFLIVMVIDFFEYLKKSHRSQWKQLSFDSMFGIPAEKSIIHLIRPLAFIRFLFSPENLRDRTVTLYKTRVKLCLLGLVVLFLIFIVFSLIF